MSMDYVLSVNTTDGGVIPIARFPFIPRNSVLCTLVNQYEEYNHCLITSYQLTHRGTYIGVYYH